MVAAHAGRHLTRDARTRQTAASFRGDNPPMEDGMRILLVEDEPTLAATVARALEREGWVVDRVGSLAHAFGAALSADYRVILLDRRLPDGDGLRLVAVAKSRPSPASIIVLTARDEIADRIEGLDAGADDYLSKPYHFPELLARVRALLRRGPAFEPAELSADDLVVDTRARSVLRGGAPIQLTTKEYTLLEYLLRRKTQVVTRSDIAEHVWDDSFDPMSNLIEVYIQRLRRKIDHGQPVKLIHTTRGAGYSLAVDNDASVDD